MEVTVEEVQRSAFAVTRWMEQSLISWGVHTEMVNVFLVIIQIAVVVLLTYVFQWIARLLITFILGRIGKLEQLKIANYLIKNKFPTYFALWAPMSWIMNTIPIVFEHFPKIERFFDKSLELFIVMIVYWMIVSIIRSIVDYLLTFERFKDKPIESYFQVVRIFFVIFALGAFFTILTNTTFSSFFKTMGAASAITMLIFKDTILGFVASVQVTTNDMVRLGDWITMPKYGADGYVVRITLNTVKVSNFDKTIITIPTYALISESFQNWRGMQESGGRRIKRSIQLSQTTIRYISDDELPRFQKIQFIKEYIVERQKEINAHNEKIGGDRSVALNGRNLTNIGLFRKYAEMYIRSLPFIRSDFTLMVRQLAPTSEGLPIEIYCFTNTTNWVEYEGIMADIFDHLTSATQYFDLCIYEGSGNYTATHVVFDQIQDK